MTELVNNASFQGFAFANGKLADCDDNFPSTLYAWDADAVDEGRALDIDLGDDDTAFLFAFDRSLVVADNRYQFTLNPGMYAAVTGSVAVWHGKGIVVVRHGYRGMFTVGGPIEEAGRLRYIDGCSDSLLIPPVKMGDACLNHLHFPPGIIQTMHTHPSARVGMVASGRGECVTPEGIIPLTAGMIFNIKADGLHKFNTYDSHMDVIAFHPDSDFGATDDEHPMINRTMVDGVSAKYIDAIRTKE